MVKKRAFTLIEILVVTSLIGFIAVIFTWWALSRKSEKSISAQNVALYNMKNAMIDLTYHLTYLSKIVEIGDDEIIAKDWKNNPFSYYINEKNELIRASLKGLDEKIIAKNIEILRFKLLSYNRYRLIKFEIKMSGFEDLSIKSSVFLRCYK